MHQQDLFKNIFGTASGPAENISLLQQVTTEFPYFGIAHFYLLQATDPTHPGYHKAAAKAAIHFNNPFLLNYTLKKEAAGNNAIAAREDSPAIQHETAPALAQPKEEANDKNDEQTLVFEPLYTTDYFASQGIKLSDEVKPDDKLGKQLKSFTDWLKTMKKVHDQRLPAGNEQLDLAVQQLAEKSNMEDQVLTESMAEAYLSQGKPKKAAEIYQKLSLFNPAKSAYFAAKIASLKDR
jgi:hypothetical protein